MSHFRKTFGAFLMTFFAVWLFVGAVQVHSQMKVQVDPDEYPWLSFTSMEEFQDYMDSIKDMTEEELEQHDNDIGFYSMRRAMNEVGNPEVDCIGGFETAEPFIEDPYLASALNPKGIIQIEADVIVVAENVVYRVPEDKTDLIDELDFHAEEVPPDLPPGIEAKEIERGITTITQGKDDATLQAMGFAGCFVRYNWRYRLLGYSWASNFWFYASSGAVTISQRRWRWLWWWWWRFWPVTWVQVNTNYNLVLWPWGINVAAIVTRTRNNAAAVYVVSVVRAGWGVFLRGTVTTTHTLNNNGNIVTCSTTINI